MKAGVKWFLMLVAGAALLALGYGVGTGRVGELAPRSPDGPATSSAPAGGPQGTSLVEPGALDRAAVARLLGALSPERRKALLEDAAAFRRFLDNEAETRALLKAALDNRVTDNPQVGVLMERAAERVLIEAYLRQLLVVNTSEGFPTETQIREYFERNPRHFRQPRRVHLWQVFWAVPGDAPERERRAARAQAAALAQKLRAGDIDFGEAALAHSQHAPSRESGGYMGLIDVPDLLPPVREAVDRLEPGSISDPIATESGIHVIKRGAEVAARTPDFEAVRAQARRRLVREHAAQLRGALARKARESYPAGVDDDTAEQWRTELQGRDWKQGASTGPTAAD